MILFQRMMGLVLVGGSLSLAVGGCEVDVEDSTIEGDDTVAESQQALVVCGLHNVCSAGNYTAGYTHHFNCSGSGNNATVCLAQPSSGTYAQCSTFSSCAAGFYTSAYTRESNCILSSGSTGNNAKQCTSLPSSGSYVQCGVFGACAAGFSAIGQRRESRCILSSGSTGNNATVCSR